MVLRLFDIIEDISIDQLGEYLLINYRYYPFSYSSYWIYFSLIVKKAVSL